MALSNIKRSSFGDITHIRGDITHTEGASEESTTVAGGRIIGAQVLKNTSDGVMDVTGNCPISWSSSGYKITVTIHGTSEISSGSFWLLVE